MNYSRDEAAACLAGDGAVYVVGGYGARVENEHYSCLRSVERFKAGKWEEVSSMNEGRRAHAVVSLGDYIYAIGGYNGKDHICSIERYSIQNGIW